MQNTSTTALLASHQQYRIMHQNPSMFSGGSLRQFLPEITSLINSSNIHTVLDYGCGKAQCYKEYRLHSLWQVDDIKLYDPGVDLYSTPPNKKYDLTICTDVMEHVPEESVDQVLEHIASCTTKMAFFSISTRPAKKILPDGRNAHLTIKSPDWWIAKLNQLPFYAKAAFPC